MAAKKYISINAGVLTEVQATVTSAGAGDDGEIVALDATGRLSTTVMPVGVGAENDVILAYETLLGGDLVNIFTDGGVIKVRKADANSVGKEANGFVLTGVTANGVNTATVYRNSQSNTQITATLTPGTAYYLSTSAGEITATPPSDPGNIVQHVGKAFDASTLIFEAQLPIILA